ncbi:hypothetical protein ACFE04_016678 [Oxalis oulophora]
MSEEMFQQVHSINEMVMEDIDDHELLSLDEYSTNSLSSSSSSLDLVENTSSSSLSSSSSSSSSSNGPLYDLSEALMAHLPIKKGLSKYYQGKSESFKSLASVESFEDLAKKGSHSYHHNSNMRNMKSNKRGGSGFIDHKLLTPKSVISKKASSSSRGGSFLVSSLAHKLNKRL